MLKEKALLIDNTNELNNHLIDGWEVKSVTAQHIGIVASGQSNYPKTESVRGQFLVILKYKQ